MNQGIIAAVLSILFYLTSLLSGGQGQAIQPAGQPIAQQSYTVLGQMGTITADRITVRNSPSADGKPLGTLTRNTAITILDQSDSWYKIRPRLGAEGWVPDYSVDIQDVQRDESAYELLGFYPGGEQAYESLLENGARLTGIAPLGWQLGSYGQLTVTADFNPEETGRSLYFAGNQKMDTFAHISVDSNPSPLLSDAHMQAESIRQIQATVKEWGLKGVLIDIAYIPGEEQTGLYSFLNRLKTELEQEELKTILALPWSENIDYAMAAKSGQFIMLQGKGLHQAGPLASVTEVKAMLEEVTSLVPAEKVILAVAAGGVDWSRAGVPSLLSHREVLELAAREGASVKWDTGSKTPYFKYSAGREVWFENRYSIKYKFDLAREFGLGGLALKDLGQEDPEIWTRL